MSNIILSASDSNPPGRGVRKHMPQPGEAIGSRRWLSCWARHMQDAGFDQEQVNLLHTEALVWQRRGFSAKAAAFHCLCLLRRGAVGHWVFVPRKEGS